MSEYVLAGMAVMQRTHPWHMESPVRTTVDAGLVLLSIGYATQQVPTADMT